MSDPTGGPVSVTFDEIESQEQAAAEKAKAPQATDLNAIKLDGADVPESLRGKSIADVVKQFGSVSEALKISEQARLNGAGAPPAPPAPEEPKDLTNEEINTIYQEDPARAMAIMQEQSDRRANKNLETRLGPLAAGAVAQTEAAARAKYADEFALFGDQIAAFAQQIPNAREVLTNPKAWDDLISLIRGRGGNFERLIEHKQRGGPVPTREKAQQEQQDGVGFTESSGGRGRRELTVANLDPVQKEIAAKMNMTEADYVKWSRVS